MNVQKLHDDGYLVIQSAFSENTPGLLKLHSFASEIQRQQVCLEFEEVKEQSTDPTSILVAAAIFRSHVVEFLETTLECKVQAFSNGLGGDLDYVRRKFQIGSFTPCHTDSKFLTNDRSGLIESDNDLKHFFTVWIPFIDLSMPHSHLQVQEKHHRDSQTKLKKNKVTWKSLLLPKYSIVIFSCRLKHRATAHRHSSEARTSVDFRFKLEF